MNFEAIRNTLEEHIQTMPLPYSREMWEAIDELDVDRLNSEIIRVHTEDVEDWQRLLYTRPHAPEGSCHPYAWVMDAYRIVDSEPPVFTIPKNWGVNARELWARWQAHKARSARAA